MAPRRALRMATAGGADALKRDDIGTLDVGEARRHRLFRVARVFAAAGAENDPVAALVLAPPARATHVMVDGRFAVWDGHLVVDEDAIVQAHRDLVRRLVGHLGELPFDLQSSIRRDS